jgi:hypothetical protein
MSEIAYTELEGFPIRWAYNQAMPMEEEKIASTEPKTWNVSQTASTQKANTNTSTDNAIYMSNMVAQIFQAPSNATKVTQIQLYGRKVGSPPNPLYIELRKAEITTPFIRYSPGTASDKTLVAPQPSYFYHARVTLNLSQGDNMVKTLQPNLPAGTNVILASVYINGGQGYKMKITRGNIVIAETLQTYNGRNASYPTTYFANQNMLHLVAVDSDAPQNAQYSLIINSSSSQSRDVTISFVVFNFSNAKIARTSSIVSVAAGATQTIVSLTPGFSSNKNVVIAILGLSGGSLGAGNFRIKKDTTIVCGDEFGCNDSAMHMLVYVDTSPSSTTQYSIEVYNNNSAAVNCEAILFVMNVSKVDYVDAASAALDAEKNITINTTVSSGKEALVILVGAKNDWGSGVIAEFRIIYSNYTSQRVTVINGILHPVIIHMFPFRVNNPSLTLNVTGYYSTSNLFEYKIAVIELRDIPSSAVVTGQAWVEFPVETDIYNITFSAKKYCDSFATINVKVYQNNVLKSEDNISATSLSASYTDFTTTGCPLASKTIATRTIKVLITTQVDYLNGVTLKADNTTYQTLKKYYDGYSWSDGPSLALTVRIYGFTPTSIVLASGSIAAASVGTSDAWISINLSIVLRPNEYYAIVVYTIGGDSSNYYAIKRGASGGSLTGVFEHFLSSSNSGASWTIDSSADLSVQVMGYQMTKIYSGTRDLVFTKAPASPILSIFIYAQTSSSMEFAAFDDYVLAASPVTSTSASQTKITVLSATDPRYKDPGSITQISWEIWAAGVGLSTRAGTQVYAYYNKTPVTPRDFGFSELYLIQARAVDANSIAIINDHFAGILYFQNSGDTFTPPSMFRVPVKKIHVMEGRITFDLLGVV